MRDEDTFHPFAKKDSNKINRMGLWCYNLKMVYLSIKDDFFIIRLDQTVFMYLGIYLKIYSNAYEKVAIFIRKIRWF